MVAYEQGLNLHPFSYKIFTHYTIKVILLNRLNTQW